MTTAGIVQPRLSARPPAQPVSAAREAALRPFARPGRGFWLLAAVCVIVVVNGLVAWVMQLQSGMGVAGYNDHAFWAIYIADVVTFIGVSYGGAVISAILRLTGAEWRAPLTRLAEGTAVVTVLIGGAFIIPHLGRPDRVWELVTRPNLSSPIFWDFIAVATYTVGSIIFFILPLIPDMAILHRVLPERIGRRNRLYARVSRGWVASPRQRLTFNKSMTLIAIMIIPLAVSVHSVLSWAFSLVSRPWWHESIWAPYFVVAALYSGVALVILVVAAFRRAYHLEDLISPRHFVRLGYILAAFAAAYLYLTFADILPDAYVGEPGPTAIFTALLTGQFAPYFWTFVVAAGVLPLMLVAIPRTRTVTGMVVASALIVPSMWMKRMLMVLDPGTFDRITYTWGGFHFTWVSVSVTLAGLAAIPLLLMLMFRLVPLISIDEVEEAAHADHSSAVHATVPNGSAPRRGAESGRARPAAAAITALMLGGGLLLAATGATAHAAAPAASPAPAPAAHVDLAAHAGADGVVLTATVTLAGGAPLGDARVNFFEKTTEFGPSGQLVPVGSETTDDTGMAQITYVPPTTGAQQFTATYAGSATAGAASGAATVTVTTASSPYRPAPGKPFAQVGDVLLVVLMITVVSVWITLIAQLVRVLRVCRTEHT